MFLRRSVIAGASATHERGRKRNYCSQERVLRYPDGVERRICYPVVEEDEFEKDDVYSSPWSSLWWTPPPPGPQLFEEEKERVVAREPSPVDTPQAPSTSFTMTFNWADIRRQAAQLADRVRSSYQVLHGCPWPVPRPMFVLSVAMTWSVNQSMQLYKLRTRTAKGLDVVDELSQVLGNASLAASLSLTDMQDGVVALSTREQAEWFAGRLLSESGDAYNDVHICEVSSYDLFRLVVGEAKGCVVALGFHQQQHQAQQTVSGTGTAVHDADVDVSSVVDGVWLPSPLQLAHSLRGPYEWDLGNDDIP